MKTEYQAITISRDGKRMYTQGRRSFKTREDAQEAINKTIEFSGQSVRCGSLGVSLEKSNKEEPYDIVGFEIRKRQVTEWDQVEEIKV